MTKILLGNLKGPKGDKGDSVKGDPGPAGPNTIPAADFIGSEISRSGSPAKQALLTEFVTQLTAAGGGVNDAPRINALTQDSAFGIPKTVVLSGEFDLASTMRVGSNVTLDCRQAKFKGRAGWSGYMLETHAMSRMVKSPWMQSLVAAAGGTLAAGTYAYQVSAVTATGETMAGARRTVTLATPGSAVLTWTKPTIPAGAADVTSYRIWGRSAANGVERTLLATVPAGTLTWTDNGSVTPQVGAYPPATNTTFGRTHDVTILGGEWDGNGPNRPGADYEWPSGTWAGHIFNLFKVDRLTIRDPLMRNAIKWAIAIADFTDLRTDNLQFLTTSDGIHVVGPGKGWQGDGFTGTVGDDLIGMSLVEWPTYAVSEGDLEDITVKNIHSTANSPSAVRMLHGTRRAFRNITIDGVTGEYTKYRDAATGEYTVPAVGIVFCDAGQADETRGKIGGVGGSAKNITIRGVLPGAQQGSTIRLAGALDQVTIDDVNAVGFLAVDVTNMQGDSLTVRNPRATEAHAVQFYNSVIDRVTVNSPKVKTATPLDKSGVYVLDGNIGFIGVTDPVIEAALTSVYAYSGTVGRISVSGGHLSAGQAIVKTRIATSISVRNVDAPALSAGAVGVYTAGAATVALEHSGLALGTKPVVFKDGSQLVTFRQPGVTELFVPAAAFATMAGTPAMDHGAVAAWLAFDQATQEQAIAWVQTPAGWDAATVRAELLWLSPSASTGDVVWRVQIRQNTIGADAAVEAAISDVTAGAAVAGTDQLKLKATTYGPAVAIAGGKMLGINVFRNASSGSDTLPADAGLVGVRLTRVL
jgi:hypothetical protein